MCEACNLKSFNRRDAFRVAGGLFAAAMVSGGAGAAHASGGHAKTSLTPDQALQALKDGNARYVSNPMLCSLDLGHKREAVASGQAPWAVILGCADSRVPPELVFGGVGPGELFIARNAGNLADTSVIGTIEYGTAVAGAPLLVVLGHSRCGAVAAACDVVEKKATFPGSIGPMIEPILPAALAVRGQFGDFVDNTVRESARRTAHKLMMVSPVLSELVSHGSLKVVVGHYQLDTGKVEFSAAA